MTAMPKTASPDMISDDCELGLLADIVRLAETSPAYRRGEHWAVAATLAARRKHESHAKAMGLLP